MNCFMYLLKWIIIFVLLVRSSIRQSICILLSVKYYTNIETIIIMYFLSCITQGSPGQSKHIILGIMNWISCVGRKREENYSKRGKKRRVKSYERKRKREEHIWGIPQECLGVNLPPRGQTWLTCARHPAELSWNAARRDLRARSPYVIAGMGTSWLLL